jgi:hypothetical protein
MIDDHIRRLIEERDKFATLIKIDKSNKDPISLKEICTKIILTRIDNNNYDKRIISSLADNSLGICCLETIDNLPIPNNLKSYIKEYKKELELNYTSVSAFINKFLKNNMNTGNN